MCDYCDCRSHPAIASLSEDHEQLAGLLARLVRATDEGLAAEAADVAARVHDLLHRHALKEEAGVFAGLRAAEVDDDYVGTFEADHEVIHRLVVTERSPTWRADARKLAATLRAHIEREEYDLFPSAHQLLAPSEWDRIDAVHEAVDGRPAGQGDEVVAV